MNVTITNPNGHVSGVVGWPKHAIPLNGQLLHDYPWHNSEGTDAPRVDFDNSFEPSMEGHCSSRKSAPSSSSGGCCCCCSA